MSRLWGSAAFPEAAHEVFQIVDQEWFEFRGSGGRGQVAVTAGGHPQRELGSGVEHVQLHPVRAATEVMGHQIDVVREAGNTVYLGRFATAACHEPLGARRASNSAVRSVCLCRTTESSS